MPRLSTRNAVYINYLYERLQRHGYLLRDCQRLVNTDRNHFAACMVALGDADAMVTGVTRNFSVALEDVQRVIDPKPGHRVIGVSHGGGARTHRAGRRYRGHRDADCRRARRDRHRGGGRGAPARLRAAAGDAGLLHLRPSGRRALGARDRGGENPRPQARRFRIRRRNGRRCGAQSGTDGALSILPPVRARPMCW